MTIPSPNTNVFVSKVDLFDYKSGEPSPEYRTILRVIDVSGYPQPYLIIDPAHSQVSDGFVLRILINQAKIERNLLTLTRSAADELLSGMEKGGQCLTADLWRVQRYRFVSPCPHLYILHKFIIFQRWWWAITADVSIEAQ